ELGRDRDLVADRLECFADELLVRERPVDLRGVEEADTTIDGRADERDHLLPVGERREAGAHPHAAEPDRRELEALSECALLHLPSPSSGAQASRSRRAPAAPRSTARSLGSGGRTWRGRRRPPRR